MSRHFADWLDAFMAWASFSESPEKFIRWAGVSALAGALERRVWVDQGRYTLYPNSYIIFVAKAGKVKKSASVRDAMGILRGVEGITFGPDVVTWEYLVEKMTSNQKGQGSFLDMERPQTSASAVIIDADELSTFFDPTNKGLVSALIKLWDCPPKFDRGTRSHGEEYIENPCVNLIAGTTPSWIKDSFDRWSKEGGFAARTIFVYADKRRQRLGMLKRRMPLDRLEVKAKLVADLRKIATLQGEYAFDDDAYHHADQWYESYGKAVDENPTFNSSTGFSDRKLDHVLKLAMILAASRRDRLRIALRDVKDAILHVEEIEHDLESVFTVLDERVELRPYNDIKGWLAGRQKVSKAALVAAFADRYMLHEIDRVLASLREAGEIELHANGPIVIIVIKNPPLPPTDPLEPLPV